MLKLLERPTREEVLQAARPIIDWINGDGRSLMSRSRLYFSGFCQMLRQQNIRIERSSLHIRQLHPQFAARTLVWDSDSGGAVQQDRKHGVNNTSMYWQSPVKPIYEGGPAMRQNFENESGPFRFPIWNDLKIAGYSDYVILPLAFTKAARNAISFSTRREGGFTDLELAVIEEVMVSFAASLELIETQRMARQLLESYVGPKAGAQVLAGDIQRGQGQSMNAILWISDLRDFSGLSNRLPENEVISHLNAYFDSMANAIHLHNGEILKFIGDAVLAIFPIECPYGDWSKQADNAVMAAREALDNLEMMNAKNQQDGKDSLKAGVSLNVGEVIYGNIGSADRLDFTVIGPAVNLAARLQDLTKRHDPPIVLSQALAEKVSAPLVSLGEHRFRGFEEEAHEAFALKEA